jgi:glucose/mannose transport system substrate-binding protein
MSTQFRWLIVMSLATIALVALAACAAPAAAPQASTTNNMEMYSWWTGPGEADGLAAMFAIYKQKYPSVNVVNATTAGGAGTNAKAVLATRLQGGNPPDAFQLHAGLEAEKYSPDKFLEPLDDFYKQQNLAAVFPKDLITLLQAYEGHFWGVPVNIHRANVLWYNKKIFADNNLQPPASFDDFFKVADALKAKGITAYCYGSKDGFEDGHQFETVLIGKLGADGYKGLWTGKTAWNDAKVTDALNTFKKMLTYSNDNHAALSWDGGAQLIMDGKCGMQIMGDWEAGAFTSKNFTDYGWAPAPGNGGIFDALADSFALPKGVKDHDNAIAWLTVAASKEGQEAFNPKKGSICARTDCNQSLFNPYSQSAAKDWTSNTIVPSVVHGAAAIEKWSTQYQTAMALFADKGDVAGATTNLQKACTDAGVCK